MKPTTTANNTWLNRQAINRAPVTPSRSMPSPEYRSLAAHITGARLAGRLTAGQSRAAHHLPSGRGRSQAPCCKAGLSPATPSAAASFSLCESTRLPGTTLHRGQRPLALCVPHLCTVPHPRWHRDARHGGRQERPDSDAESLERCFGTGFTACGLCLLLFFQSGHYLLFYYVFLLPILQ